MTALPLVDCCSRSHQVISSAPRFTSNAALVRMIGLLQVVHQMVVFIFGKLTSLRSLQWFSQNMRVKSQASRGVKQTIRRFGFAFCSR
jgi:hypothetical protein